MVDNQSLQNNAALPDNATLNEIMNKAKEMQQKMQSVQQKLAAMVVKGVAGGGMVEVTINGQHVMTALEIDSSLFKEPVNVVQDVIMAAHKDAVRKLEDLMKKEMATIAQEMGLPQGDGSTGQY